MVPLAAVVIAAVASIQLPAKEDPSEKEARLLMEGRMGVRQTYWAANRAPVSMGVEAVAARQALRALEELAATRNTKQAWRLLALSQYILRSQGWRSSLGKLADAEPRQPLTEVDRELAMWRIVMEPHRVVGGKPSDTSGMRPASASANTPGQEQARRLEDGRRFLASLDLGWYRHPALEALYRNHGLSEEARRHKADALRGADHLTIAVVLGVLAGLGGLGIWCTLLLMRLILGRDAFIRQIAEFPPIPGTHARHLAMAAAAYFVGLIALKMLSPVLSRWVAEAAVDERGRILRLALTAMIGVASLLPPALVLRAAGLLRFETIGVLGLTRLRMVRDPFAAIAAYMAAIPVLVLTLVVSSSLFDPSGSPVNPAIEEFVAGESVAAKALMLMMGVVIAPFTEELVFRGILLRSLHSQLGTLWAITLSSAIFAILHPQLPMGFLSIFSLGAAFAALYRITGSIWPSVFMHAINNSVVFAYLALALAD